MGEGEVLVICGMLVPAHEMLKRLRQDGQHYHCRHADTCPTRPACPRQLARALRRKLHGLHRRCTSSCPRNCSCWADNLLVGVSGRSCVRSRCFSQIVTSFSACLWCFILYSAILVAAEIGLDDRKLRIPKVDAQNADDDLVLSVRKDARARERTRTSMASTLAHKNKKCISRPQFRARPPALRRLCHSTAHIGETLHMLTAVELIG
jgi:hypothetical protein